MLLAAWRPTILFLSPTDMLNKPWLRFPKHFSEHKKMGFGKQFQSPFSEELHHRGNKNLNYDL